MTTTKTPTLPSSDELDLANYKIGSFGSDLDALRTTLKKCWSPLTAEEYLRLQAEGIEPDEPHYDRDLLARIVAYATDWQRDLARIGEDVKTIQAEALELFHEQGGDGDPDDWRRYQTTIRQWHEAALKRSDDDA